MKKEVEKCIKKNWFFLILLIGVIFIFLKRYLYLSASITSNPDSQIIFQTTDKTLEQTWQPTSKFIAGIQVPYYAENDFSCDVQLKVFSDDYSDILIETTIPDYMFIEGQAGSVDFSFGRTPVIQGERYRIQISLLNPTENGVLQIASGSNYGGCRIADQETNQAAALKITFVKYSRLFWLMAVFLPLLTYSLFMMVITGRKWEETVGISILLEGIILYLFGIFEQLNLGVIAIYVVACFGLFAVIFLYNKKNMSLKSLLSPGFFIYCALFLIILLTSSGDWLGYRDEMRHWGIAVRDMFYYDSFAKHNGTTLILTNYLPFAALIEYLFVYMNGLFSEDILFIAYQTILLSMLIVLCKPFREKDGRKLLIPIMTIMICIPVIFFHNISNTIMVDSLLASVIVYILICYYSEEMTWFNRIRIIVALIALTLIKDMGLVFAGLTAFIMFSDTLSGQIKKRKLRIKELVCIVLYVVMILMVYLSWQFYLNKPIKSTAETMETKKSAEDAVVKVEDPVEFPQRDSEEVSVSIGGITLDGVIKVISGEGEEYQYQVTRNFLTELFDGETYVVGPIKLSFFDWMALASFGILSLTYFGCWKKNKARMYMLAVILLVASCLLCFFLQITYWFAFSLYEALELTSMDRYLAPFVCAITIVVVYLAYVDIFFEQKESRKKKYLIFALTAFFVVSMPVKNIVTEGKDIEGNTTDMITYGHDSLSEILHSVARRGERVYFICSNSDGYSEYVFRNAICPVISEHENWNIVASQEIFDKQYELYGRENIDDNVASILSPEEWKGKLQNCQYVVVFHADELFRQSYNEVFGQTEIEDGSVYRVLNENGNIALLKIGTTGIKGWH